MQFQNLEKHLHEIIVRNFPNLLGHCFLKLTPDLREGFKISLTYREDFNQIDQIQKLKDDFNNKALKHEQIQDLVGLSSEEFFKNFKNILK